MTPSSAGRLGVGVIGMGHVGPVIASALRAAGHALVGVSAGSPASRERADAMLPGVPVLDVETLVERSELVVLAIPDDEIAPTVAGLARVGAWQPGQLLVHLSGAHGVSVLEPALRCGVIPLAIHPAMTFTGTSLDVARLVGAPFAVTAAPTVLPIAQALVVEMGGEPVVIDEAARPLYHAALAHGANFTVTLVAQARAALAAAGVADTGAFLRPLVEAAVDRALREGAHGVSGPVRRGDAGTVAAHLAALGEAARGTGAFGRVEDEAAGPGLGDVAETYAQMTRHTVTLLREAGELSDRAAAEVLAALGDAG